MSGPRPPERRQLTVVLCDLVGWTALSQRLDAEQLAEVVLAYRERCARLVTRHGGVVAQYVGDGILAYFGYPRAHEDDAERAIRAALEIAAPAPAAPHIAGPAVHIGIATGVVVVGALSGDTSTHGAIAVPAQTEVSAVGAALNLAARLQGLAAPGMVVVSEQTRRLSRGVFAYEDLGRHALKGFDDPVQAWRVVRESQARSRFHALRAPELTPLVNREQELAELRRQWESARSGRGRAVLIASEPGVGKSRLVDELARRIVSRQGVRLWFYCAPHLEASPLAPVVRQLAAAAGLGERDDDDTRLNKLTALAGGAVQPDTVPLLADLLSIPFEHRYPPLNMSAQRRKQRLFQALTQLLEANAASGPVLLIVEDLHWIDPSSEELIGLLLERLESLPLLAVFTARPEFRPAWEGRVKALHMRLAPLGREESIAMIESICGERGVPQQTIARIAERADGLPLFIEDLTRDVLETADTARSAVPATLTDSLMSRLDRLGSAKAVAQICAAIGREFAYALLARVAERPEDELKDELYRLVQAGLLTSAPSTGARMYAFKHALVRDAAYSSLLKKAQASLHARIAEVLVRDFPDTAEAQPAVLAAHFEAAGDVDNAVQHRVRAAKLSARHSGFVEAIAQLQGALTLLAAQPPSGARTRLELRVRLALGGIYAEYRGFSSKECAEEYGAALALCRALGEAPEIFSVLSGVGAVEITRANFGQCRALAEECLTLAARQQAKASFIMGHLLLGGTQFLCGEFIAAREHLEKALALYDENAAARVARQVLYVQDQKSTGLSYLCLTLAALGYPDSGLRRAEEGLAHSRALGGPHTVNYSLCYLAALHHFRRDDEAALRCATESLQLAREQGFATWIGVSQMIRGAALVSAGAIEEGVSEIAAGLDGHAAIEAATYQPFGLSLLATGLMESRQLERALEAVERAVAMAERTGERFYLAELMRLKGEILARAGSTAQAERALRDAIELARRQAAKLFELRAAVSLCTMLDASRRPAAAREVLEPAVRWFKEAGGGGADLREATALLASA
jgi:class 3 adenylate cyclase/predicted ATPase